MASFYVYLPTLLFKFKLGLKPRLRGEGAVIEFNTKKNPALIVIHKQKL